MYWQDSKLSGRTSLLLLPALAALVMLLSACSSGEKGMPCEGKVQTLSGQPLGNVEGTIVDRFTSFSVTLPDLRLESGPLHSSDRQHYIPSAVNREGWLAQRLSDTRFSVINAPQDKMITFSCPARAL
ncbi:hypothetical protein ACQPT2_21500 [Erwinia amylovora]